MHPLPRVGLIQGGDSPDQSVPLAIDPRWRESVELACLLKDALDHVTRWPKITDEIPSIKSTLREFGFVITDFADKRHDLGPQYPWHFVQLLMGQWFSQKGEEKKIGCIQVPAWSVMGWVFKHDRYADTPKLTPDKISQLANDVPIHATKADPAPSLYCIGGMPLFFAGEGKNRAQLFRLAQRPYDSACTWYAAPNAENFVAARLVMTKNFVVLKGIDKGGRRFADVLPFGELSKKLLEAAGVPWQDRPSWSGWFALWRTLWRKFGKADLGWVRFRKVVKTMVADEKTKRLRVIGGFDFASGK